jgi:hypothetical protein
LQSTLQGHAFINKQNFIKMEERIDELELQVGILQGFIGDIIEHLNVDRANQNFSPLLAEWFECMNKNLKK